MPTNDVTNDHEKSNLLLEVNDTEKKAFVTAETALEVATHLAHSHPRVPAKLNADASDTAIGYILQQFLTTTGRSLISQKLKSHDTDTCYGTISREILAIYLATKPSPIFLEERPSHVLTGHRSLNFTF